MNAVETPIAAVEPEQDEAALVMEALKIVHGQTMMRPTMAHLKALTARMHDARSHLICAMGQSLPSDDQIIMGHVRDAARLLEVKR